MQFYGDPGVLVPNESYSFAWHRDDNIEPHSVNAVKWILLQCQSCVDLLGHPHITQCQSDFALQVQDDGARTSESFITAGNALHSDRKAPVCHSTVILYQCVLTVSIEAIPIRVKGLEMAVTINLARPGTRLIVAVPLALTTDTCFTLGFDVLS